jgi:hypothetical protein
MRYQSLIDFGFMDWLLRKVFRFKAGCIARELRGRRNFVIPSLSSGPHLALCRIGRGSASRDGLFFLYLSRTTGRYHDGVINKNPGVNGDQQAGSAEEKPKTQVPNTAT